MNKLIQIGIISYTANRAWPVSVTFPQMLTKYSLQILMEGCQVYLRAVAKTAIVRGKEEMKYFSWPNDGN